MWLVLTLVERGVPKVTRDIQMFVFLPQVFMAYDTRTHEK